MLINITLLMRHVFMSLVIKLKDRDDEMCPNCRCYYPTSDVCGI